MHPARLNIPRRGAAAIAFHGQIWACGGGVYENSASVEVFDPLLGTWRIERDMARPRWNFTLVAFEDEIYAVGGDGREWDGTTSIEKRNKDTQQWELVTDSCQNRGECSAVLVGSKIFLIGGGDALKNTFDFFDLRTKTWASQDQSLAGGAYYDLERRRMPCSSYSSTSVLITPPHTKTKTWTDLRQARLKRK